MPLPRERAQEILALRNQGLSIRVIAHRVGCAQNTVSGYISGRRTPGRRAAQQPVTDAFVGYCRQRLTDDPHLRTANLLTELTELGYTGARTTFYRALRHHNLTQLLCQTKRRSGSQPMTAPTSAQRSTRPLPVRVTPVTGEMLASYLARVAAGNHIHLDDLLTVLPAWFHHKIASCDDRGRHHNQTPVTKADLHQLSRLAGVTAVAFAHALPALASTQPNQHLTRPVRITTACRRCMATRGVRHPVPVHLPSNMQICIRHGIWLSGSARPQLDIAACSEIVTAHNSARRLLRRLTPQQLLFARVTAARHIHASTTHRWRQRVQLLRATNPLLDTAVEDELVRAAIYPDAIDLTTSNQPA